MSSQIENAITAATKISKMVNETLAPLDQAMRGWPKDFRSIVWTVVAQVASRRAKQEMNDA